ncbi:MAG: hypothetical protein J6J12_05510 [Oscillospiraceae bacterium]|nr:hypothetical protein [Oscillospiraceae bacterium]
MDEHQEAGVWQRVMAPPRTKPSTGLEALEQESAALAAIYRRIQGNPLARQLAQEEQAIGECLRGIRILSGSGGEQLKHWAPKEADLRRQLRGCYHRTRCCQTEYLSRALDPEFGEVFRQLADRAGQQCVRLTRLLGTMT